MGAGRPRTFDEDEVLDRAVGLFWSEPYDGVGVDRLARVMGLSKPSVYNAFGGKSAVFTRVVQRYRSHHLAGPGQAIMEIDDPREALNTFLRRSIDFLVDPSHPGGCLLASNLVGTPPSDPEARSCLQEAHEQMLATFRSRARQAHRLGLLRQGVSAEQLAIAVYGTLFGLSGLSRMGMKAGDLRRLLPAVDALWAE